MEMTQVAGVAGNDKEIKGAYIGDLLSLVMSRAQEDNLWVTIQAHENVVAVASLVDVSAIIVAEGITVEAGTIAKANDLDIPIFECGLPAFAIAKALIEAGVS
jgi:predicted transcriptional regulator